MLIITTPEKAVNDKMIVLSYWFNKTVLSQGLRMIPDSIGVMCYFTFWSC